MDGEKNLDEDAIQVRQSSSQLGPFPKTIEGVGQNPWAIYGTELKPEQLLHRFQEMREEVGWWLACKLGDNLRCHLIMIAHIHRSRAARYHIVSGKGLWHPMLVSWVSIHGGATGGSQWDQ